MYINNNHSSKGKCQIINNHPLQKNTKTFLPVNQSNASRAIVHKKKVNKIILHTQ